MPYADLVNLLLGGGLAATVAAAYKGLQALRAGARSKEKELVTDLQDWRREANDARKLAEKQRDYWRDLAAGYRFMLRDKYGETLDEPNPPVELPDKEIAS